MTLQSLISYWVREREKLLLCPISIFREHEHKTDYDWPLGKNFLSLWKWTLTWAWIPTESVQQDLMWNLNHYGTWLTWRYLEVRHRRNLSNVILFRSSDALEGPRRIETNWTVIDERDLCLFRNRFNLAENDQCVRIVWTNSDKRDSW